MAIGGTIGSLFPGFTFSLVAEDLILSGYSAHVKCMNDNKENSGRSRSSDYVGNPTVTNIPGDDNTVKTSGGDMTEVGGDYHEAPDEGVPSESPRDLLLNALGLLFRWISGTSIGTPIERVLTASGITAFLLIAGSAIAATSTSVLRELLPPLITRFGASFIPIYAWFWTSVAETGQIIQVSLGVLLVGGFLYIGVRLVTHCQQCGRLWALEFGRRRYPERQYRSTEGYDKTPERAETKCRYCDLGESPPDEEEE